MGDDAVIVRGSLTEASAEDVRAAQQAALFSTVHGAGRVMSRTQAAGKRNRKTGQVPSPGRVSSEMMREWIARKGVILRCGGSMRVHTCIDDLPMCSRRRKAPSRSCIR